MNTSGSINEAGARFRPTGELQAKVTLEKNYKRNGAPVQAELNYKPPSMSRPIWQTDLGVLATTQYVDLRNRCPLEEIDVPAARSLRGWPKIDVCSLKSGGSADDFGLLRVGQVSSGAIFLAPARWDCGQHPSHQSAPLART